MAPSRRRICVRYRRDWRRRITLWLFAIVLCLLGALLVVQFNAMLTP
jgi:hypothetical protein